MIHNILSRIKNSFKGLKPGNVIFYPGCMTQHCLPKLLNNYKSLLVDIGVDFKIMNELKCCGSPLLNAGISSDFEEVKKENLKLLRKNNITKIITNCPHCYDIFKNQYKVKVEHITQTLAANKHKLIIGSSEEVVYHDPCLLSRKNNIIKEPRAVLNKAGFLLSEPSRTKGKTFCCGAGGGLKQSSPKISNKIAKERLKQFELKKVIVSCPYCYVHLKENAKNSKEIIELSETLSEE